MLKLFSGNTFIDRPSGREAETRRGSLIVVVFCVCVLLFFHCKLSVFILPVLSGLIFISAHNGDTEQVALPSTSSAPSFSGEGAEEWD